MKKLFTSFLMLSAVLTISATTHQDPPPQSVDESGMVAEDSNVQQTTSSVVTPSDDATNGTTVVVVNPVQTPAQAPVVAPQQQVTNTPATTQVSNNEAKINELKQQLEQQQQLLQMQQQQMQQLQQQQMQMQINQLQQQINDLNEEQKRHQQAQENNNQTTTEHPTTTLPMLEPVLVAPVPTQPAASETVAATEPEAETSVEVVEHKTAAQKYYGKSGKSFLSIVSVGYSTFFTIPNGDDKGTDFAFKRHLINFEIFEWRAKIFGMQLFNFEIGMNTPTPEKKLNDVINNGQMVLYKEMRGGEDGTYVKSTDLKAKDMWFAYKPSIKFYIPCAKGFALELYGGAEVELSKFWNKVYPKYYEGIEDFQPEYNYFLNAYGGLGLVFSGIPAMPLEVKAEYRHNLQGNPSIVPQGIYISAQLHLGAPIGRKQYK